MAASGSPPDVARVALEGMQLVAHKGMALPLDPFIKRDQGQLKDYFPDVNQNMLKSMSYNGKQYQLPSPGTAPSCTTTPPCSRKPASPAQGRLVGRRLPRGLPARHPRRRLGRDHPNAYWGGVVPWLFLAGADFLTNDWKQSRANDPHRRGRPALTRDLSARHRVAPRPAPGPTSTPASWPCAATAGATSASAPSRPGCATSTSSTLPGGARRPTSWGPQLAILKDSKHHEQSSLLSAS